MRDQLEQFYKENADLYVKRLSRRAGSVQNAEDIVQEAFYRALKYIDSFDPNKREMETWFNSILRRSTYDFKRVELKQGMAISNEDAPEEAVDMNGLQSRMVEEVEECINQKKNKDEKYILYLFFIRGYPPRDIVKIVDANITRIYNLVRDFKIEMGERYGQL